MKPFIDPDELWRLPQRQSRGVPKEQVREVIAKAHGQKPTSTLAETASPHQRRQILPWSRRSNREHAH
ncbi:MAG: hypothetical protein M0C28_41310 [Candidatus Moduliflexus flocculans]|nr:hypothetical protein [Candidatus Moduliflexus flocculans]